MGPHFGVYRKKFGNFWNCGTKEAKKLNHNRAIRVTRGNDDPAAAVR